VPAVSRWFQVALASGLLIGLGEAAAIGWRYFVRGALTHMTPHVVWMAPIGYALLFAAVAILLLPFRSRGYGPLAFALAGLGLFGWIAMLPWALHPGAIALLAFGAAAQIARLAAGAPARVSRAAGRALMGFGAITLAVAAAVFGVERRRESAAIDALGEPPSGAPNVLLLILDTVRAKSLGLYGGAAWISPEIDAFAADAITFDRAISTAPWTLPSHASMFTGRWPHELSVGWTSPLDDAEPTLAEALSAEGYATGGFVANLSYASRQYGLQRGFAHYEDFPISPGQMVIATSLGRALTTSSLLRSRLDNHELLNRKSAGEVNQDLLEWIDGRGNRPFFAFLNYFDAHEPYEPPRELRERVAPGYRRLGVGHRHNLLRGVNAGRLDKWKTPADVAPKELALYEAAINSIDVEIGRLLDELGRRGLLDRTLVILTSDHGEQMGEHGLWDHMQSLYQPVTHVPLVIRPPGGVERLRVEGAVSLRDLPATVMDVALSRPAAFPGYSLAPLWGTDPDRTRTPRSLGVAELERGLVERQWYPIAPGLEMQSITSGTLFYICNPDATEELYDLATDPAETRNLVGTEAGDQAVLAFRRAAESIHAPPPECPPAEDRPPRAPRRFRERDEAGR